MENQTVSGSGLRALMGLGCSLEMVDEDAAGAPTDPVEDVAEAESEWTREECYAGYRINMEICNRLPGPREQCFAGCHAMLVACLAGARG